jgi:hypothetical protein
MNEDFRVHLESLGKCGFPVPDDLVYLVFHGPAVYYAALVGRAFENQHAELSGRLEKVRRILPFLRLATGRTRNSAQCEENSHLQGHQ